MKIFRICLLVSLCIAQASYSMQPVARAIGGAALEVAGGAVGLLALP